MKTFAIRYQTWIIVFLLVTNVSTLLTIAYHNQKSSTTESKVNTGDTLNQASTPGFGRMMREKLGLSHEQNQQLREVRQTYNRNCNQILQQLRQSRECLYNEMIKEAPDSLKIDSCAGEIGALHKSLKIETTKLYRNIKLRCNCEQKQKLDTLFRQMIGNDNNGFLQHGRHRYGRGGR